MSNNEPEEQFGSEDELRALLQRWDVPEPSRSLDERVASSYLREISEAGALRDSILLPQTNNEVVTMKLCFKCQEEFADKFSFCPVDGTSLSPAVARHEEPSITAVRNNGSAALLTDEPEPFDVETAYPSAAASSALAPRGEYHLTMMDDSGLVSRLADELKDVAHQYQLTWPEFRRDPIGFVKRSIVGYGQMVGRVFANRNVVIAMGGAVFALVVLVAAIILMDRSRSPWTSRLGLMGFAVIAFTFLIGIFATWLGKERGAAVMGAPPSDSQNAVAGMVTAFSVFFLLVGGGILFNFLQNRRLQQQQPNGEELVVQQMIDIPANQPTPDAGTAGMAKGSGGGSKPKQEKAAGGGGGGREEQKPASAGKLPQADLSIPQVVAPDPHPPVIKNPVLPVAATLDADPKLFPPDPRNLQYGDPKSKSPDPSSGPGTGNGIGQGKGGGVGPGEGGGYGPGRGGNTGGGDRNEGGGGAGGGGGGAPDYNRIFSGKDVTQKAKVLSKPEPQYTEDARKNQITGTVTLRVVFTSGGQVTEIRAIKQLPYGLTEKAMAAARMIRFIPAMKDGRPVSMYMQLEYNFNLY
jgi:TonB family protein